MIKSRGSPLGLRSGPQVSAPINIPQAVHQPNPCSTRRRDSVSQSVRPRPTHALKQPGGKDPPTIPPNQPEPAILGWSKHDVMASKRCKCPHHMPARKIRNIRPHQTDTAPGNGAQSPQHPLADVTPPLRHPRQIIRPEPAGHPGNIRGHRQNNLPTRITQPPDQITALMTKPPGRRNHANIASKPGFHPPGAGFFDHDYQGLTPQTARSISICKIPASGYSDPITANPNR